MSVDNNAIPKAAIQIAHQLSSNEVQCCIGVLLSSICKAIVCIWVVK